MKVVTPEVASPPAVACLDFLVGGGYGSPRAAISTSHPLVCELPPAVSKQKETSGVTKIVLLVVVLRDLYLFLPALEQVSLNTDRG